MSNQREAYKAGRLKPEREEALLKLGFVFEKEDSWQIRYHLAEAYYDEHGTLNGMPANYAPEGIWINKWLNEQKQIYRGKRKGKTLTDDKSVCWKISVLYGKQKLKLYDPDIMKKHMRFLLRISI